MSNPEKGTRIVKTRPWWPGTIQNVEEFNGETFYHVRFDDPGLDDELLRESEFEVGAPPEVPWPKARPGKSIWIFANGNVAVTDEDGEQMVELQGSLINWDYVRGLGKLIATEKPTMNTAILPPIIQDPLDRYVEHYRKAANPK